MASRIRQGHDNSSSVASADPLKVDPCDPHSSPSKLPSSIRAPKVELVDEGAILPETPRSWKFSCFGVQPQLRYLTFLPLVILFFIAVRSQDVKHIQRRHSQRRLDLLFNNSRPLLAASSRAPLGPNTSPASQTAAPAISAAQWDGASRSRGRLLLSYAHTAQRLSPAGIPSHPLPEGRDDPADAPPRKQQQQSLEAVIGALEPSFLLLLRPLPSSSRCATGRREKDSAAEGRNDLLLERLTGGQEGGGKYHLAAHPGRAPTPAVLLSRHPIRETQVQPMHPWPSIDGDGGAGKQQQGMLVEIEVLGVLGPVQILLAHLSPSRPDDNDPTSSIGDRPRRLHDQANDLLSFADSALQRSPATAQILLVTESVAAATASEKPIAPTLELEKLGAAGADGLIATEEWPRGALDLVMSTRGSRARVFARGLGTSAVEAMELSVDELVDDTGRSSGGEDGGCGGGSTGPLGARGVFAVTLRATVKSVR